MEVNVNTIEINILRDKSKQYLNERLETDGCGLTMDSEEIRKAFSDGCLFTVDLAQKIVEEMFASSGEAGESLARYFRNCLFENIKSKEISL